MLILEPRRTLTADRELSKYHLIHQPSAFYLAPLDSMLPVYCSNAAFWQWNHKQLYKIIAHLYLLLTCWLRSAVRHSHFLVIQYMSVQFICHHCKSQLLRYNIFSTSMLTKLLAPSPVYQIFVIWHTWLGWPVIAESPSQHHE